MSPSASESTPSAADEFVYGKLAEASALYDQYLQVADVARVSTAASDTYCDVPPQPVPLTLALRIFD